MTTLLKKAKTFFGSFQKLVIQVYSEENWFCHILGCALPKVFKDCARGISKFQYNDEHEFLNESNVQLHEMIL